MDAEENEEREPRSLQVELTSKLGKKLSLLESMRSQSIVDRLKPKLSLEDRNKARNLMDVVELLEKDGTIGPGKNEGLKDPDCKEESIEDEIEATDRDIKAIKQGTYYASGSTASGSNNNEGQNSADGNSSKKRKSEEGQNSADGNSSKKGKSEEEIPEILDDNRYKKEPGQIGYMLILNVISKERQGSENDVSALRNFFSDQLGFTVNVKENMTKDVLVKTLSETKQALTGSEAKKYYCFICVVMSHGSEGGICTTDQQKLKMNDITAQFKNTEFKDFIDKPKIFIVQACRGKPVQELAKHVADDEMKLEDDFIDSVSVPKDADIHIAYATTDGHLSFRHIENGSWFINVLVEVLKEKYEKQHFEEMLVSVRHILAHDPKWRNEDTAKKQILCQMPCSWTTLTKLFYLKAAGDC